MRLLGTPALFQGLRCDSKTPSVVKKEQVSAADDIFDTLVVNDDFCLSFFFLFHIFFVIQFVWTFPFFLTCSCICDKTSNPFLILQLPVYMYLMDYDYFYHASEQIQIIVQSSWNRDIFAFIQQDFIHARFVHVYVTPLTKH